MATTQESKGDGATKRRKLRPLVITMGGDRQKYMEKLFAQPDMAKDFEPPAFSPGVPQRSLRNRVEFLRIAHQAGLIPPDEWKACLAAADVKEYQDRPDKFFECLQDIPITPPGRKGSKYDLELHYCVEFWRKSRGINRGRAVLACIFAHLIAMKRCVEEGFDFILEDNVRAAPKDCAERIWQSLEASKEWEVETNQCCHLRYFGWLGSIPNIDWVLNTHSKRSKYNRKTYVNEDGGDIYKNCSTATSTTIPSIFPFPITEDFGIMDEHGQGNITPEKNDSDGSELKGSNKGPHDKPGGTPIWGAYAYWVSRAGLDCLLSALQKDVGAILWKGKRMRCHLVKPIDKVMPRQILGVLGRECIHVTTHPAFFRAPMLTSKIHTQWDAEFCKSTEFQLKHTRLDWLDLWLPDNESKILAYYKQESKWLTMSELMDMAEKEKEQDADEEVLCNSLEETVKIGIDQDKD